MVKNKIYTELTRWELRWFAAAVENGSFSKDPSTKAGTVIVDPTGRRRISEGYNGFPQKIKDTKEKLHDRSWKYANVIHSEMNAILYARCDLTDHHLFSLTPPCDRCCAHIIQTGITKVYWVSPSKDYWSRWGDGCLFGRDLMEEAGIEMIEYMG